jgi:hypothetical protein
MKMTGKKQTKERHTGRIKTTKIEKNGKTILLVGELHQFFGPHYKEDREWISRRLSEIGMTPQTTVLLLEDAFQIPPLPKKDGGGYFPPVPSKITSRSKRILRRKI